MGVVLGLATRKSAQHGAERPLHYRLRCLALTTATHEAINCAIELMSSAKSLMVMVSSLLLSALIGVT